VGARFTGLWRHVDFLKLWFGQTTSVFGSLIGGFALPLVAALTLAATPMQMALLSAAGRLPELLFGLVAGVWVDRLRRRPLMVGVDLGRALLLATVPLAALLGWLRIELLLVVALLVGLLTVFFAVAYHSYLPTLLRREQLVEGNSKLEASNSVAEVAGFGLAGLLVQALTAPIAVLVDALSFVASAASLALIRAHEPAPTPPAERPSLAREIGQGLRLVWADPILRALAGASATRELGVYLFVAVLLLFLTRDLALEPAVMGLLFAIGGIGSFVGALVAERVTQRFGLGPTLVATFVIAGVATLAYPLAGGPLWLIATLIAISQATDCVSTIHNIARSSLIQAVAPDALRGRVNATLRVLDQTAMLAGLLIGGLLGELIGLRPTMFVGLIGALASVAWLLASPVPALRALPDPTPAPTADLAPAD
jgi:MFS family permease